MLAIAAAQIGYRTHIFAPEADAVAIAVSHGHATAAYDDIRALNGFAQSVDVITFEFENVPLDTMRHLSDHRPVWPSVGALGIAQDRLAEKNFAVQAGVPLSPFAQVQSLPELKAAIDQIGCPAILKTARDGYDGKGQVRIDAPADAEMAWQQISIVRAVLERRIDFLGEISVLLTRTQDGEILAWDCPENIHHDGILHESRVPARAELLAHGDAAKAYARQLADALDYVGVLACEFFITADGPLFNELAPRVHNSGHWTIEGAVTSQFENHIRAICGLPLGSTALRGDSVTMRNIIGAQADGWLDYFADPDCHLHLYGKGHGRAARKMGHATWVQSI